MTMLSTQTPPWRKALLDRITSLERELNLLQSVNDTALSMLVKGHSCEAETITRLLLDGSAHRLGHGNDHGHAAAKFNEHDGSDW